MLLNHFLKSISTRQRESMTDGHRVTKYLIHLLSSGERNSSISSTLAHLVFVEPAHVAESAATAALLNYLS